MTTREPVTLVEIDIPVCSLTYGTAPCTASVGVTGDAKCFNSIRTCQDRGNFERAVLTLRLMRPTPGSPYDAIPNVVGVSVTPPVLDPGKSMGVRASCSVTCADHPHGDGIFDKYLADRGYDAFKRGSFWPKLRARFPSLEGAPLRVLRGNLGDALEDMRTEHYFISSVAYDNDGVKITAKDALSFCDPKKAQCPTPSTGRLTAAISSGDSSFSVLPAGIGDLEYPSAGYVCLSNKEIMAFTRSGDTFSVSGRPSFGSSLQSHSDDAVVQLVKVYEAQSPAAIVYDLLVNFTPGIDASWCNLPAWSAEVDAYVGHLYTAVIPAPTAVNTLINEMCEQAGLNVWGDAERNTIELRTLRPVVPGAVVHTDSRIVAGSFKAKEQPDRRVSLSLTYYNMANAVEKLDKEPNFMSLDSKVDEQSDQDYDGLPAIRKSFSRWIGQDNRTAARRLNNMIISRFRNPPRDLAWSLYLTDPALPKLGEGLYVSSRCLQDVTGDLSQVPTIVTSINPMEDGYAIQGQELVFADQALDGQRTVFIDSDHFNLNLRTLYDSLYSSVPEGEYASVTFILSPGAWIGSTSASSPALTVGTWAEDCDLILVIGSEDSADAQILGYGGKGGGYPGPTLDGENGGTAIYTRRAITITNLGRIGGGGGGGAAVIAVPFNPVGAGGGAGFNGYESPGGARIGGAPGFGAAGSDPQPGGTLVGGLGGDDGVGNEGGNGGDLGANGQESSAPLSSEEGVAGACIDGVSFVTFTDGDDGSTFGAQIN